MPETIDGRTLADLESEIGALMRLYFQQLVRDHLIANGIIGKGGGPNPDQQ